MLVWPQDGLQDKLVFYKRFKSLSVSFPESQLEEDQMNANVQLIFGGNWLLDGVSCNTTNGSRDMESLYCSCVPFWSRL